MFRKLLTVGRLDAELPREVRAALIASLFAPFGSLIVGAVSGAVIGVMVSQRADDPWLTACAFAICLVAIGRIVSAYAYRRYARPDEPGFETRWERIYEIGAWSYSGLLGVLCCLAILRTDDLGVHLVVATTTAGYAAGITGRNAGRPLIAISQLLLAAGPLSLALLIYGDALHFGLGIVIFLFMYGMTDITLSIRDIVVQALVTTRDKAALAARYAEQAARFDAALNNASHGLCMFGPDRRLVVWNERFLELSGLSRDLVRAGATARDLVRGSVAAGHHPGSTPGQAMRALVSELSGGKGQTSVTLGDGRTLALSRRLMQDGGSVVIFEDVTDRRRAEERIARMARFDELTGLPNRTQFRERIAGALAGEGRHAPAPFALHLIDLDYFKAVNDTLGHPMGDRLLQAVAARLERVVEAPDMIARLGGDEFVVLQFATADPEDAEALAQRILQAVRAPFEVDGHRLDIGASIGVALFPTHGTDGDKLFKCADMALYAAKAAGRGALRFFAAEMDVAAQERRALELDLRHAMGRGELQVYFQPIVDLSTNRFAGCEALLRWRHPTRGFVSPAEFIPIAEETGLIIPIGEWVVGEACAIAATWPRDMRVAVNLSPVQFKDPHLPMRVIGALARTGLPASRLELEITETAVLQDSEATLAAMNQLQHLGVHMSLDDFGTGFSSLSYLRTFPFQKIKIDQSFTRDLGHDPGALAIVRAVSAMGKDLGMRIVVEGVETKEQLDLVRREGCSEVQGYLMGRPMTPEALAALIAPEASRGTA
jgi:diguanylate cyclase (GGDEF)-like protein